MTTTKIYMIRHAKSVYINGQEKTRGLSEKGCTDSHNLVKLLNDLDIDAVYSSDYLRAEMTVKPLANHLGLVIQSISDLRERKLKPANRELSFDCFLEAIKKSYKHIDFKLDGGESIREAQERSIPIIEKLLNQHKNKSIVIGTHGNIMTAIFNYYDQTYGFDFWQQTTMPDIYVLEFVDNVFSGIKKH